MVRPITIELAQKVIASSSVSTSGSGTRARSASAEASSKAAGTDHRAGVVERAEPEVHVVHPRVGDPEPPHAHTEVGGQVLEGQLLGARAVADGSSPRHAFAWRGELVVGYGPRTEELALKHLATDLGVSVRGIRITHPGMYHMDIGFCPLDETRAMVCPAAYDEASAAALLDLVPEPLVLTEEEGLAFCANSIVIGRTIVMPACPDRVRAQLEEWGFEVVVVEVGEFLKGGGAIRCLTNPLDVRLGRDLAPVAGGRVTLPDRW